MYKERRYQPSTWIEVLLGSIVGDRCWAKGVEDQGLNKVDLLFLFNHNKIMFNVSSPQYLFKASLNM